MVSADLGTQNKPGVLPQTGAADDVRELTILMPCLNEAETIAACIGKANAFIERKALDAEVLVADNGSTDGSQDIARSLGARVVDVPDKGYGAALSGGIEAAKGRYIVMGDADDSYDFSRLDRFLDHLRDGSDLVMGNRFRGGISAGAMPPLHRYLGNPVLSFLGRLFFRIPVGDFHCGLRGFKVSSIRSLDLQTTGMEFASEMVVRAALANLRISEVPTTLDPDGRSRAPHLKTWRDGWRHLKFLLMYSPRWLFFVPGVSFVLLGLLLSILLFFGPLRLPENLVLDLNAFIASCFMILVGMQLLTFGIVSRYYAAMTGFLPSGPRSEALLKYVSIDRLIWIAGGLFLVGLGFFGYAWFSWGMNNFGSLTSPRIPRIVISGLAMMVIGLQTFFSAFLLGILEIPISAPRAKSGSRAQ